MENKLVIMKDLHCRSDYPFFESISLFVEWFLEQPFNNESNYFLQLGDFCHSYKPDSKTLSLMLGFIKDMKFKKKIFLTGNLNHSYDVSRKKHIEELFLFLDGVEVDFKPTERKIGCCDFLTLPWIYGDEIKEYEKLRYDKKFDGIFYHFEDETMSFGKSRGLNISSIDGFRLGGHIHKKCVNYDLGMPVQSRSDEIGEPNELLCIDIYTKKKEIIQVPKFLEYYNVTYPEIPKIVSNYSILNIKGKDKNEAETFYRNELKNVHFNKFMSCDEKEFYSDFYNRVFVKTKFLEDVADEYFKRNSHDKEIEKIVKENMK